ncbi:hypothetical protein VCR15J2_490018 [Vibrio coralliirubri]|nr:hypothetical protein VCR15J2_490018 [Vibrio coralliirubri]
MFFSVCANIKKGLLMMSNPFYLCEVQADDNKNRSKETHCMARFSTHQLN